MLSKDSQLEEQPWFVLKAKQAIQKLKEQFTNLSNNLIFFLIKGNRNLFIDKVIRFHFILLAYPLGKGPKGSFLKGMEKNEEQVSNY